MKLKNNPSLNWNTDQHSYAFYTQYILGIDIDIFSASGYWRTDKFITRNNGLLNIVLLEYLHYFGFIYEAIVAW